MAVSVTYQTKYPFHFYILFAHYTWERIRSERMNR